MSKRKASAISPPLGQTENEGGRRRSARLATAAARRDEPSGTATATRPTATSTATAAAAVADSVRGRPIAAAHRDEQLVAVAQPTATATAAASAGSVRGHWQPSETIVAADSSADSSTDGAAAAASTSSSSLSSTAASSASSSSFSPSSSPSAFGRLAVVELQLVLQCCDRRSLVRLARCSRFTLTAAAHPFAWRSLPLRLHCSRPSEIAAWRPLQSAESLQLRHADLTVHWTLESAASAEEVAAALSLPRLCSLVIDVVNDDGRLGDEPTLGEPTSIALVNALRSQLDDRRPSPNFVLSLSLRYQKIGAAGSAAIVDLVERSQSLTRLDLQGNDAVQGDALIALAVAAGSSSSSLRHLNLSYCGKVDAAVAVALAHALTQSHSLTKLELQGCNMDAAAAKALSPGVKASSSLQRLDLGSNRAARNNLVGVTEVLKNLPCLMLSMSGVFLLGVLVLFRS